MKPLSSTTVSKFKLFFMTFLPSILLKVSSIWQLIPGLHSTLLVSFHLQRHMGDFVIQVIGKKISINQWVKTFPLLNLPSSNRQLHYSRYVLVILHAKIFAKKVCPRSRWLDGLDVGDFVWLYGNDVRVVVDYAYTTMTMRTSVANFDFNKGTVRKKVLWYFFISNSTMFRRNSNFVIE